MKKINNLIIFILTIIIIFTFVGCGIKKTAKANEFTSQPVYKYTFDFLGENVMPTAGYVAPTAGYAFNGAWYDNRITNEQYLSAKQAGINLMFGVKEDYNENPENVLSALTYAEQNNIVYLFNDSQILNVRGDFVADSSTIATRIDIYKNSPAFGGLMCIDEPSQTHFNKIKNANDNYKTAIGNKKSTLYVNLFPTYAAKTMLSGTGDNTLEYADYVSSYIQTCNPEYLSYDYYPFNGTGETTMFNIDYDYFNNLGIIRKKANENQIPFWIYIQAGGKWENMDNVRIPNENEILWQVNTGLACGAKGIQYFPYASPPEWGNMTNEAGLINKYGTKNAIYYYVKKANQQLSAIDNILMNSSNAGVIVNGNSPSPMYGEMKLNSYRMLNSVTGDDCIVGCFDYSGKTAYYVVSNSITKNKSVITLKFDSNYCYDVIQRGQERSTITKNLEIKLAAGEGALVVPR